MNLVGSIANNGPNETALGQLTGTGTITANSPVFEGDLTGTLLDTAVAGLFNGGFFGPQALEFAFNWYATGGAIDAVGQAAGSQN